MDAVFEQRFGYKPSKRGKGFEMLVGAVLKIINETRLCHKEDSILCLPFLIDLIILNMYYPYIYNYIKTTIPADNYQSVEKLSKLNILTHKIIKTINADKYIESNLYECRKDLKNYFNLIDFAQDFN